MADIPADARAVIVGGGIVGVSLAYHLAKLNWKDVVLLERRQLTSGTTWHAAGLIGQLRATQTMTRLAKYSADLYDQLEHETGLATGYRRNGSISIATDPERFEEHKRNASMAGAFDLDVKVITPEEIAERHPWINLEDVLGGIWIPSDGQANPTDITQALARGARSGGVRIIEQCEVTRILHERGKVHGVETTDGVIRADFVVICGGMWSADLARKTGVTLPLQACEHFYVVTEPIPGLQRNLPILRDYDGHAYYKEDAGKFLIGAFEPLAKPWGLDGIPADFCFDELPADLDHFQPVLELALKRLPILNTAGIQTYFNGPESFTPDNRYHLGETPEIANLFVAAGFNSIGIQSAGGAGKVLSEWLDKGSPPADLWDVDVRRTQPFQHTRSFLRERSTESPGLLYANHWPTRQFATARNIRHSPFHDRLARHGACFGEAAGWERPTWYAPPGVPPVYRHSWQRENWFEHSAREHHAVRNQVALFDQTPFAKFQLEGPAATDVLNRVCTAQMDVAIGRIVYTQWLNENGGIEADLTITRSAENQYFIVSAAATQRRDWYYLKKCIGDHPAVLTDVTSAFAVLGIMGPQSRSLLQGLTSADLSNAAFPFGTSAIIDLDRAFVRASRITYVGELGWELYIPCEFAIGVYDAIIAASPGLVHAGAHAMNSLRMEKAYRHWGHDISDADTPLEAGLAFTADWTKAFIGRAALLAQKSNGLRRRLAQFKLLDPQPLLHHSEPIWRGACRVGYITSAAWGHTLGSAVGMGYVSGTAQEFGDGSYSIEIAGERHAADISRRAFYDPSSERTRS